MEISYSHRFIFVHVYRVGGQSVSAALRPYSYVPRQYFARVPVLRRLRATQLFKLQEHYYGHIKAKELKAGLPPEIFDSFLKFAFVRNPWEWHVSIYHYVRQRTDHPDHELFTSFRGFEDYFDWRLNRKGVELQSEFILSDSGDLLVDFVGRYETLAQDFATVCSRIGIDGALPHNNRSTHRDFREYYTPETRDLVAEAYKDDIDFLGYEFGQPQPAPPIMSP